MEEGSRAMRLPSRNRLVVPPVGVRLCTTELESSSSLRERIVTLLDVSASSTLAQIETVWSDFS